MMIRQAEASKAKILSTPGNLNQILSPSAVINESYFVVGAHLDETTIEKIGCGEYMVFRKLLPRDKVIAEENCRFEMIIKNSKTFWVPASNSVSINPYAHRWEQAIRAFSNVYCKTNPNHSAELIEYNNVIHMIAKVYIWKHVYTSDKEF